MIFVTVGTQLPFPRLMQEMDRIAGRICEPVIAQTCDTTRYMNMIVEPYMSSTRYNEVIERARLVVAHAGIGTVMAARQFGVPAILVPRRADLGEHRNDHQIGTIRQLIGREGIRAVWNPETLDEHVMEDLGAPALPTSSPALDGLVTRVRSYIG